MGQRGRYLVAAPGTTNGARKAVRWNATAPVLVVDTILDKYLRGVWACPRAECRQWLDRARFTLVSNYVAV